MDGHASWGVERGKEAGARDERDDLYGSASSKHYQDALRREELHKEGSSLSSLSLRETQEESLARLASPIGVVSSILAGTLVTLFLNPPQTIYSGYDSDEWIGCCKDMPQGTCYRFSVACIALMFIATSCAIASLIFIVAATLKATAAARRPDKLEGSTAAIANFIAAKWMLFACVYLAYIVMLLYVPLAYPLVVLILSASILGVGSLLTIALFWGNFWKSVGEDLSLLQRFFSKKANQSRARQQQGQQDVEGRDCQASNSGTSKRLGAEVPQPHTPGASSMRQDFQRGGIASMQHSSRHWSNI